VQWLPKLLLLLRPARLVAVGARQRDVATTLVLLVLVLQGAPAAAQCAASQHDGVCAEFCMMA
jgi:hypothetical protein